MKFRNLLSFSLATVFVAQFVLADPMDAIGDAFNFIFEIGGFVWVNDQISATKFALFLIIFAVVHFVLNKGMSFREGQEGKAIFGGKQGNKVSTIIAFSAAAISVIFIPTNLVWEIGMTYSAVFSLLIVGLPLILLIIFAINATKGDTVKPWVKHLVRFFVAIAGIALVSGVAQQYGALLFILPLMPVYEQKDRGEKRVGVR